MSNEVAEEQLKVQDLLIQIEEEGEVKVKEDEVEKLKTTNKSKALSNIKSAIKAL